MSASRTRIAATPAATARCELRDVQQELRRDAIIRGVSLDVARGERHAIIGPNGAGKSTLFNLISGRLAPDEAGRSASTARRSPARRRIASTGAAWRAASR